MQDMSQSRRRLTNMKQNNIPKHIAIIMDGNGRWAMERNLPRTSGHQAGVDTVKRITEECVRLGVEYLTLYTFSTENWNRPADEVAALMGLILTSLEEEIFMKNNVRFRTIGDRSRLPEDVRTKIKELEDHTANNNAMTAVIALSYSSRWEITETIKQLINDKKVSADDITEDFISSKLQTSFMPDPDLLIRTGGELRISNYLLWQIAYSELYFCDTYWPDFMEADLCKAIEDYQSRQRRFGKTEKQIEDEQSTQH